MHDSDPASSTDQASVVRRSYYAPVAFFATLAKLSHRRPALSSPLMRSSIVLGPRRALISVITEADAATRKLPFAQY